MQGTLADYKNELLFSQFGLNYNALPERFRKVRGVRGGSWTEMSRAGQKQQLYLQEGAKTSAV